MERWLISVGGGYGSFVFEGSEDEAEEMRAHKANWEHAVARKWRIPELSPWLKQGLATVNGASGFLDTAMISQLVDSGACEWKNRKIQLSEVGRWILDNEP
jgi:hypothetical protein